MTSLRTRSRRTAASTAALLWMLLPLTGCAAAVAGSGLSSEGVEVHTSIVRLDVEEVWYVAQDVFGIMSAEPLLVQDFPRQLTGHVDGARVILEVQALDINQTKIRARASRFGFADSRVGDRVLQTILARLDQRN